MARNYTKKETESLATDEFEDARGTMPDGHEENVSEEREESGSDGIIRIGEHAEAKKLNKFDMFCLKIWTYIVAFITTLAKWINTGIFKIFKKKVKKSTKPI